MSPRGRTSRWLTFIVKGAQPKPRANRDPSRCCALVLIVGNSKRELETRIVARLRRYNVAAQGFHGLPATGVSVHTYKRVSNRALEETGTGQRVQG